jgi:hypothetical protein
MKARIVIALVIIIVFIVSGLVHAQSGGGYDLTWYTVDNGGVSLRMANEYQLGGTIGQPDAGGLSGGDYTLVGGFWWGGAASKSPEHFIYLPFVLKNSS